MKKGGINEEKKERKVFALLEKMYNLMDSFMRLSFFPQSPFDRKGGVWDVVCVHERNGGMFGLFAGY